MPRSAKSSKTKTPRVKPTAPKASTKVPPAIEPTDEELNKSDLPASQRAWSNQEIAALLDRIGDILAIEGENRFKIIAYQRASDVIEHSSRGVQDIWSGDPENLRAIPGVGEAIAEKLDELFRTGLMRYYEKIRQQIPEGLVEMLDIPGVGPKTVAKFWKEFNITTLDGLKQALEDPEKNLKGIGDKTIENLRQGIATIGLHTTRVQLATATYFAQELIAGLKRNCGDACREISTAGSLRRLRPTIGDLDLVVASDKPEVILDAFVALPEVREVLAKGGTKASIVAHNGLQADLRVLEPKRWGTALQYFTGSREHNIRIRDLALKKGLSLSEWSFLRVKNEKEILCDDEAKVYETLGMDWIPPELREATGEIEAAIQHKLPKLIELRDLKGDLQCHSRWSDGKAPIRSMAEGAQKRGLKYIAITDHSKGLGVANGLDEKRTRQQWKEIDRINQELGGAFRVLKSVEVEIRADGSLDLPDDLLAGYDLVLATTHTALNQSREKITERVLKALRHPYVDIFGHPTGRLIGSREESALDLEQVFQVALETGTILEIDGTPERMDLDGVHARRAKDLGLKLVVDSDAHYPSGFDDLQWGIAMARRGWLTKQDVLNTLEWDEMRKHLKRYRKKGLT
ncbi:MAG TPA: DNA polymerase/3'-5' exonuclease PolX [Anaerolineae bacterium]|nr:DNA polymerase/3'-5' exonuclease PolX [Anaerolineae bacterium]